MTAVNFRKTNQIKPLIQKKIATGFIRYLRHAKIIAINDLNNKTFDSNAQKKFIFVFQ